MDVQTAVSREGAANPGFFLAIAGNIGVGKTELTTRLSQELGWVAYYEPVIQNPYLDPFYKDMPRWSFHLQIYFLSERFKAQVEISKGSLPFIQDRTIYEDAEIFARVLHAQGSMTQVDYENYTSLFGVMVDFLRKPDVILYLKASPETLMGRIAQRGRESEKGIGIDYIRRLSDAYDAWMVRARAYTEVMEIDTDSVPLQGETPAFRRLVEDLKRRYPRQVELPLDQG
ncbi:MAG: deoxynucleoside kinase [Candidatus Eisenbacteria bacterium]|uniref:Deoxynucleoside kinase n=1 Tax=Eiseniibacteriota bacterium TaxID=2212470 RepID=A0A933WC35_UNCEI|nr:deoxynucleoside kinase [Candidatus Eisenbacteria bacterium]